MNTFTAKETLPAGYAETEAIDLVKNKKQMLTVNLLAVALAVVLLLIGFAIAPDGVKALFDFDAQGWHAALKWLVICAGTVTYVVGHEAVHGVFMWHYSHIRPRFGLSISYAYAGSECFFAKNAYLAIALAPLTVWMIVLLVLQVLVPAEWFWVVWFIQIMNISGAAGDLFVFALILRKPKTVLVQDTGTAMTVYLPQN